jgi:hypothetical protein
LSCYCSLNNEINIIKRKKSLFSGRPLPEAIAQKVAIGEDMQFTKIILKVSMIF